MGKQNNPTIVNSLSQILNENIMSNYENNVFPKTANVCVRGPESAINILSQNRKTLTSPYDRYGHYASNHGSEQASTRDDMGAKVPSDEVTEPAQKCPSGDSAVDDRELLAKQALKYADDLATLFEEEKSRAKALQHANERLKREISIRLQAEKELLLVKQGLERRVKERTRDLSSANERLQREVNQRKQAEEQLRESLREKETLIVEVHHRVKNNLQIISSLLGLQCNSIDDENVLRALQDSRSRITSMALIHEQLYCSKDLAAIDFTRYLDNLSKALMSTHCQHPGSVSLRTEVDNVVLPVGTALPCSLIINELLTNCLKHAFPENRHGDVLIEFRRLPNNAYSLTVTDDGIGLPENVDYRDPNSLGLQLVKNLAEFQLRGALSVRSENGTRVKIEFVNFQDG